MLHPNRLLRIVSTRDTERVAVADSPESDLRPGKVAAALIVLGCLLAFIGFVALAAIVDRVPRRIGAEATARCDGATNCFERDDQIRSGDSGGGR